MFFIVYDRGGISPAIRTTMNWEGVRCLLVNCYKPHLLESV